MTISSTLGAIGLRSALFPTASRSHRTALALHHPQSQHPSALT